MSNIPHYQVIVTQKIQGFEKPQQIRSLKRGDYFGEKALLRYILQVESSFISRN